MKTKFCMDKYKIFILIAVFSLNILTFSCSSSDTKSGDRKLAPDNYQKIEQNVLPSTNNNDLLHSSEEKTSPIIDIPMNQWPETNFQKVESSTDIKDIYSGGIGKDGIPPIYNPRFTSVNEANQIEWLTDNHPIAVLKIEQEAHGYPLGILNFHEIVNDTISGTPVLITYCRLCYSAVAFKRNLNGENLTFGSTGTLQKSNLIMWDDSTQSWWQQLTGLAIIGELAGSSLEQVPINITSFKTFKETYPNGKVLSTKSTKFSMAEIYGKNTTLKYDSPNTKPFLFFDVIDDRLNPVERVLGIDLDKTYTAIPFSKIEDRTVTHITLLEKELVLFYDPNTLSSLDNENISESRKAGSASIFKTHIDDKKLTFLEKEGRIYDQETGSEWSYLGKSVSGPLEGRSLAQINSINSLWFAWSAFHSDTKIATIE